VIELRELNQLPPAQFVEALAGIFEHSPWIAQRAAARRPFGSRLDLLDALRSVVSEATADDQLLLINAHPKLGARGRPRQQLTQASSTEQHRAGLDACTDDELAHLERLNAAYLARFGFPFILAVRGHDPPSIMAQMQRRLQQERREEIATAIHQIGLIAGYRLAEALISPPDREARAMLERLSGADVAPRVSEWMRAAGLTVGDGRSGTLIGTLSSRGSAGSALILGIHRDAATGSLRYDGPIGWACAVAVIQHLRARAGLPSRDLAVFSRADAQEAVDSALIEAQLRRYGLAPAQALTIEDAAPRAPTHQSIERATRALEKILLHTSRHE
jgi:beta-ureidopropionase / N-carbamoyl-L-amino-acid hydrolase